MKLIFTFLFGLITVFSCTTQIKKENEQTTLPHLTELKKEKQQNSRSYLDNGDFQKGTYPKSKYWGSYEQLRGELHYSRNFNNNNNLVAEVNSKNSLTQELRNLVVGKKYTLGFKASRAVPVWNSDAPPPKIVSGKILIDEGKSLNTLFSKKGAFDLQPMYFEFIATKSNPKLVIEYVGESYTNFGIVLDDIRINEGSKETYYFSAPKKITKSGKLYFKDNFIFVNDVNEGVHIINNQNPKSPKKTAFLNIPGNTDVSIKGDYLFANSHSDLVVYDIKNIENIIYTGTVKNVFRQQMVPLEVEEFADPVFNIDEQVHESEERSTSESDNTGKSGSMARFKIIDNYLYVIGATDLTLFDIGFISKDKLAVKIKTIQIGRDIETVFKLNSNLFIGSRSGMFIYDVSDPLFPKFTSSFVHFKACDPVVADENYAYVTLRAGSQCGTTLESQLQIIDIKNIKKPKLLVTYPLENPYGLGVHKDFLFICDGTNGLQVFDKSDPTNLKQLAHFKDIESYDVIPLSKSLLMIGDNSLVQYEFADQKNLNLLSRFKLD